MEIDLQKIVGVIDIKSCHDNHLEKSDLLYTLEFAYEILERLDMLDITSDIGWQIGQSLLTEIEKLKEKELSK